MKTPFFIMVYTQSGDAAMPLVNEHGDVKFYETEAEAAEVAESHRMALAFGFEIFEMGNGVCGAEPRG